MGVHKDTDSTGEAWKRYEDIISLPHHVSSIHPRMSVADRAAQFSPFSALTGYGDAIRETGRFTGERVDLDEDVRNLLDLKLKNILAGMEEAREAPLVKITCFRPDSRKDGGAYETVRGFVKSLDPGRRLLFLYKASGPDNAGVPEEVAVPLDEITGIEEIL